MYYICEDKEKISPKRVQELLAQSYWANKRTLEAIKTSMEHSLLYGVFDDTTGEQVAFARVITDFATTWYLCDVIVDEAHRANGIGKMMIDHITSDPRLKDVFGMLLTKDAHGLYAQYGFKPKDGIYMGYDGKPEF